MTNLTPRMMELISVPAIATLFCMSFSVRIAFVYLRKNPRLFTAMSLFAFTWVLLLPYWVEGDSSKRLALIPVYTGFLEIYVAALLALHADAGRERADEIVPWQRAGLKLLVFVVAPSSVLLPFLDVGLLYNIAGIILSIIGWTFMTRAVKRLAGLKPSIAIGLILFVYAVAEVADTIRTSWPAALPILSSMAETYLPASLTLERLSDYAFAGLKCVYTLVLGCIIAYVGMPDDDRNAGLRHWFYLFVSIKDSVSQPATAQAQGPG